MMNKKSEPAPDSTVSHIPPIHPMNDGQQQAAPTQLFLGDIDEEKRLSIARFRYDEYFEKEGWRKDWSGVELKGLDCVYKTISLKLKELWEMAGHIAAAQKHDDPERIVRPYLIKMAAMPEPQRSSYLTAVCAMLVDKHGLGLKQGYSSEWDDLTQLHKRKKEEKVEIVEEVEVSYDEPDDEPRYGEEEPTG